MTSQIDPSHSTGEAHPSWTYEQVLGFAPDASSAKYAKKLGALHHWRTLGYHGSMLWGECLGSAVYQSQVDLSEPAFRCSCPSRKFPCKHGLGLLLLYVTHPHEFAVKDPPAWVEEWAAARAKRAEKDQSKLTAVEERAPADTAASVAKAKAKAKRDTLIAGGLQDLDQWLQDRVRQGLAGLPAESYDLWDRMAARMVDAKAGGLARQLRALAGVPNSGQDWTDRILSHLSQLHLLAEGYQHREQLDPGTQADMRAVIGWTLKQSDVLDGSLPNCERVLDIWAVLGQVEELNEDDNVWVQRTWLWGLGSNRMALHLQFSFGSRSFETILTPGTQFEAQLVYYPSAYPLRAALQGNLSEVVPLTAYPGAASLANAWQEISAALARNPWILQFPVPLREAIPVFHQSQWVLQDCDGRILPLRPRDQGYWLLMALSGGHPIAVFGEWNGSWFEVLSACVEGQFQGLSCVE